MEKFIQLLVSGIAAGGIYAMAALGFVLVFKATRIINFAQGSLMMLGGYVGFGFAVSLGLPIILSFVLSAVVLGATGAAIYGISLRPLVRRKTNTEFAQVIITMGWTIIIGAVVELIWGALPHSVPHILPVGTFSVGGVRIAYQDLGTIGITVAVVIAFTLFFEYTRFGLVMRGMADNRQAAVMMGADEQRANLGAWVLAGAGAAIAGLTLSTYSPLTLSFPDLAFLAFPAVVLGGIDSIPGALAGGILIGIVQQMAGGYISTGFSETAGFIVMLAVLLVKPTGLFGSREVVRL